MPPFFNTFNQSQGYPYSQNRQNAPRNPFQNHGNGVPMGQGNNSQPFRQNMRNMPMMNPQQNNFPINQQPGFPMNQQQPSFPLNQPPPSSFPFNQQQPPPSSFPFNQQQQPPVSLPMNTGSTPMGMPQQNIPPSPQQGGFPPSPGGSQGNMPMDNTQSIVSEPDPLLNELIQNEINCEKYYSSLRDIAPIHHRQYFSEIISNANERLDFFNGMYREGSGTDFHSSDMPIDLKSNYRDGLSTAITEELTCIKKISGLYEKIMNEDSASMKARKINVLMLKKIWDISFLNLAVSQNTAHHGT